MALNIAILTKGPLLMVGAPTNKNTFEGALIQKKGVKSKLTLRHVYDVCQFTEILWYPGRLCQIINTDLMVPRLCQFYTCRDIAEILFMAMVPRLCQLTEILQRFYGALTMSIYRDFMVPRLCQFTEILQRFHAALTMSIYRDFMVPRLCQFTEILQRFHATLTMSIYRDFMVPRLCQFADILQRFYSALTMSIYRDFMVPPQSQFTEILHDKTNPVKSL